tara:strand:+ start:295 stop:837 length:543 start_codon:yes stop_codon:yes gene_type:complete
MKNFFKGIGIIVLLMALVNPMYYAYVGYHIELKKIKKEVKNQLIANTPKEYLVSFRFEIESNTFKSLEWKHSREFQYQGKMFDIVEADTINNYAHYICFPDKQETALNQEFNDLLNERYAHDKPTNNKQKLLSNFVKSLFVQNEEIDSFFALQNRVEYNKYFKGVSPSDFIKARNPPPQI